MSEQGLLRTLGSERPRGRVYGCGAESRPPWWGREESTRGVEVPSRCQALGLPSPYRLDGDGSGRQILACNYTNNQLLLC